MTPTRGYYTGKIEETKVPVVMADLMTRQCFGARGVCCTLFVYNVTNVRLYKGISSVPLSVLKSVQHSSRIDSTCYPSVIRKCNQVLVDV